MQQPITDHDVAEAMQMCGGSFVALIGKAWFSADDSNRAKLQAAFSDYWIEYTELAAMLRRCRVEAPRV